MTVSEVILKASFEKGNFIRKNDDVYITPENMRGLTQRLSLCKSIHELLITPFLVNTENNAVYELFYYEFVLSILDVPQSYYIDYPARNALPEEIVRNIKPKVIIAKNNIDSLNEIIHNYLEKMDNMTFEPDKSSVKALEAAELYYQISGM